jgi:hypothetical protein
MKQYPDDWDAERIADDQAGEGFFAALVILALASGIAWLFGA